MLSQDASAQTPPKHPWDANIFLLIIRTLLLSPKLQTLQTLSPDTVRGAARQRGLLSGPRSGIPNTIPPRPLLSPGQEASAPTFHPNTLPLLEINLFPVFLPSSPSLQKSYLFQGRVPGPPFSFCLSPSLCVSPSLISVSLFFTIKIQALAQHTPDKCSTTEFHLQTFLRFLF